MLRTWVGVRVCPCQAPGTYLPGADSAECGAFGRLSGSRSPRGFIIQGPLSYLPRQGNILALFAFPDRLAHGSLLIAPRRFLFSSSLDTFFSPRWLALCSPAVHGRRHSFPRKHFVFVRQICKPFLEATVASPRSPTARNAPAVPESPLRIRPIFLTPVRPRIHSLSSSSSFSFIPAPFHRVVAARVTR